MVRLLPSSALKRSDDLRRALTLDLATRHGEFYQAVAGVRRRWSVVPVVAVPPVAEGREEPFVYRPTPWPDDPPGRAAEGEDDRTSLPGPCPYAGNDELEVRWRADIRRLHDRFVCPSFRADDPLSELAWGAFLSGCVLFDPPWPRLLEFAEANAFILLAGPPRGDAEAEVARPGGSDGDLGGDGLLMVQPPMERSPDPLAVARAWAAFHEETLGALADLARARHGVDLRALRDELAAARPDLRERLRERLEAGERHLIVVDVGTTDDDVLGAYRLIRASLPPPLVGRPGRDPLVCVQCAVWREDGWSLAEIARRFGWKLKRAPGQSPTSERARLHAKEGVRILLHRNVPLVFGKPQIA